MDEPDIQKLKEQGIGAVLSLMLKSEYRPRGINWNKLKDIYAHKGMKVQRYQVNDMREKDLVSSMFLAAQYIHKLVDQQNLQTFVHCSSGITRAPEVVIVYLCLFKKHKAWASPESVAHFLKAFNFRINPNMKAVKKCLAANLEFQNVQKDTY